MRKLTYLLLWVVVFLLPFEEMMYISDTLSVSKVTGLAVVIFAFLGIFEGRSLRRPCAAMVAMVPFFLWSVLSLFWTVSTDYTLVDLQRLFNLLFFTWAIWEFCRTEKQFLWLMRGYILGHAVPLFMMFTARSMGGVTDDMGEARISGGGQDLNYLGLLLVLALLFAVYLGSLRPPQTKFRIFYWAFIPLGVLGVFLTGSRSGAICLVMAVFSTIIYFGLKRWPVWLALTLVAAIGVAYVMPLVVPESTLGRMFKAENYQGDMLTNRLRIWEIGMRSFQDRPLQGIGLGAFGVAQLALTGKANPAHNILLSVGVELGGVGLAFYGLALALVVRAVWKLPRREKVLWLGILAMWFVYSQFNGFLVEKVPWFILAMALTRTAIPVAGATPAASPAARPLPGTVAARTLPRPARNP